MIVLYKKYAMGAELKEMEKKINLYNEYYGFLENVGKFSFDSNPQRLIIRNYVLRTGDEVLYEFYLKEVFPDLAIEELQALEEDIKYIKPMGREELATWLINNNIKVLRADINTTDQDAIFSVVAVADSEDPGQYLSGQDGLILNTISPLKLMKFPYHIWINTRLQ